MADLSDIDPQDVSVPPDDDELTDVPVADPDAEAQVDEDTTDRTDPLADDDPNKNW